MTITASLTNRPAAQAAVAQFKVTDRLYFVDNIRVFLTILVILHHLAIIYTGSGSWIYNENRQDSLSTAFGEWFCSVNQSYFMGLFLFISAYFVPGAYDRKGAGRFLKDRLIRLGIPLALYGWVIRPAWIFFQWGLDGSFWQWYTGQYFRVYGLIGGGPLWFIEVLLIFAVLYVFWRLAFSPRPIQPIVDARFPSDGLIALFALFLTTASFVVRLWFPKDTSFAPLNLQFANFAQYIAMFLLGLYAYTHNWLLSLPDKVGRRWLVISLGLSLLPALVGFAPSPAAGSSSQIWEELLSAWWEAFMCVGMSISVIYLFRRFANRQGPLAGWFSRNAYAAYLIHEPLITALAMATASLLLYPLFKFALLGLVSIPLTFLLSALIRAIPGAGRVL